MKKFLKTAFFILITIIVSFVIIVISNIIFGGYNFKSDIDCVNSSYINEFNLETIVFKYENDCKEILIYSSSNNMIFECILDKKQFSGETKYKLRKRSTSALNTYYKNWTEVNSNLRYIFVDFEEDIKDIECEGYNPIGTKIYYKIPNGEEESCWIYVIDETIDNTGDDSSY